MRLRTVLAAAAAYVLFGLLVVIAWHTPHLAPYVPEWLEHPLSKTNLGVMRLAHFLAIAILVDRLIPANWVPLTSWILRPVINCGQHSLEVFCLGVVLAFAGYVAVVGTPSSATSQILVPVLGIGAMMVLGALVSWYGTVRISFRTVASERLAAHPPSAVSGDVGPERQPTSLSVA